jgi:hypothetical protein
LRCKASTRRFLRYPSMGNRVVHFTIHKKPGSSGTHAAAELKAGKSPLVKGAMGGCFFGH